jgi:tRNA threonylcarbamoyladenosine biosynthesis protein TsaB
LPDVITLAIDTSEARGSVSLVRDGARVSGARHDDGSDYSAWLLPAVARMLAEARERLENVDILAVATGPGSFTGLRVGLTTVKAWAEVYEKPVVGVPRLDALARSANVGAGLVAACYDAQRGQLFAALFRRTAIGLERMGAELVATVDEFLEFVDGQVGGETVAWVSLDPELIKPIERLKARLKCGDELIAGSPELAPTIGLLAEESASHGQFSDPLALDANYVRRSDAEIFWKGASIQVR